MLKEKQLWEERISQPFSNVVPGCFVFAGACFSDNQTPAPHHHPKFLIDEAALADGANMFLAIAEDLVLE